LHGSPCRIVDGQPSDVGTHCQGLPSMVSSPHRQNCSVSAQVVPTGSSQRMPGPEPRFTSVGGQVFGAVPPVPLPPVPPPPPSPPSVSPPQAANARKTLKTKPALPTTMTQRSTRYFAAPKPHASRRARSKSTTIAGAPSAAVTTPTGSTRPGTMLRATASHATRNAAPTTSESGSRRTSDGPTTRRTRCGTISPTNAIGPNQATHAATRRVLASFLMGRTRPRSSEVPAMSPRAIDG